MFILLICCYILVYIWVFQTEETTSTQHSCSLNQFWIYFHCFSFTSNRCRVNTEIWNIFFVRSHSSEYHLKTIYLIQFQPMVCYLSKGFSVLPKWTIKPLLSMPSPIKFYWNIQLKLGFVEYLAVVWKVRQSFWL